MVEWCENQKSRIFKVVDGDKIKRALERNQVERVLSQVDSTGKVKTYRLDAKGNIIGEWP
ncbi:hypothetical protein [Bacillus cereus]|uniref:hypothetical protein n=1 Tax=Bacillus cereus TaxID=1396 RepID=UPI0003A26C3B|nr:hypothetical protein [Bacillus cereus]MDF9531608.1 hypothetical protein [Bacillus cereus]